MPIPTFSLRVAPEFKPLLSDIAKALRTRPELADVLRAVLQNEQPAERRNTDSNTDVLQPILDRLTALERRMDVMIAQDVPAAPRPPPADRPPRQPQRRPAESGKRKSPIDLTPEIRRRVHDLRNSGLSRDAVMEMTGVSAGSVSKILKDPRPAD